jgi:hypothetical protein
MNHPLVHPNSLALIGIYQYLSQIYFCCHQTLHSDSDHSLMAYDFLGDLEGIKNIYI